MWASVNDDMRLKISLSCDGLVDKIDRTLSCRQDFFGLFIFKFGIMMTLSVLRLKSLA